MFDDARSRKEGTYLLVVDQIIAYLLQVAQYLEIAVLLHSRFLLCLPQDGNRSDVIRASVRSDHLRHCSSALLTAPEEVDIRKAKRPGRLTVDLNNARRCNSLVALGTEQAEKAEHHRLKSCCSTDGGKAASCMASNHVASPLWLGLKSALWPAWSWKFT